MSSLGLWWLSFADAARTAGEQSLGVAIVEAADMPSAIRVAWALGRNPGGEVQGMWVDPAQAARLSFSLPVGKLLDPAQARDLAERVGQELAS